MSNWSLTSAGRLKIDVEYWTQWTTYWLSWLLATCPIWIWIATIWTRKLLCWFLIGSWGFATKTKFLVWLTYLSKRMRFWCLDSEVLWVILKFLDGVLEVVSELSHPSLTSSEPFLCWSWSERNELAMIWEHRWDYATEAWFSKPLVLSTEVHKEPERRQVTVTGLPECWGMLMLCLARQSPTVNLTHEKNEGRCLLGWSILVIPWDDLLESLGTESAFECATWTRPMTHRDSIIDLRSSRVSYWEERDRKHRDLEDQFVWALSWLLTWSDLLNIPQDPLMPLLKNETLKQFSSDWASWWSALIWSGLMGRCLSLMSWTIAATSANSLGFYFFVILLLIWPGCWSDCWGFFWGWTGPSCWAWWRCSGWSPGGIWISWHPEVLQVEVLRSTLMMMLAMNLMMMVDSLPRLVKPWDDKHHIQQWPWTSDLWALTILWTFVAWWVNWAVPEGQSDLLEVLDSQVYNCEEEESFDELRRVELLFFDQTGDSSGFGWATLRMPVMTRLPNHNE